MQLIVQSISGYLMHQDHGLFFSKEMFVTVKRENINNFYEVQAKELGKGAFGTVFKGRVKGAEGPWRAIKKILKASIKDPNMLLNQIEVSIQLDNPNVIKLYEVYEYDKAIYLVTDLCEGGELFDRLDKLGGFSEKDARYLFRQMAESLTYLHGEKIAHRDLKPENFLFMNDKSNELKLIDFGLAYRWETSLKDELQKKGDKKIVGTSYYLAPEILSHNYDERCDIWSIGVILYVLLSAVPPFDGDNDKEILQSVKALKYDIDIPEFDHISKELKDLISKILVPADQRITLKQIFEHPWMKIDLPTVQLKINFRKMTEFSKFSKLKKLTATYVASQLSEKDVEKLGQLFRKIDVNHDGFISIEELKEALDAEKANLELQELKTLMESIDIDKNGKINYTEFLASSLSKEELFTEANLKKMFKLLDKDGNGVIEKQELMQLFSDNGIEEANGKNIDQIIQSCDKDGNGIIDFEEFRQGMLN